MGDHAADYLSYQLRDDYWDSPPSFPVSAGFATTFETLERTMPKTERLRPRPARRPAPAPSSPKKKKSGGLQGDFPPVAICLYGPPGVGKTSLFANWPKVGFVTDHHEDGIKNLVRWRQCPTPVFHKEFGSAEDQGQAWPRMLDYLRKVASGSTGVKTLVLESLGGLQKLCFNYHCKENFGNDWSKEGFYNYQQGPVNAAQTDWPELIDVLKDCWEADINVIVTAHSQVKSTPNPEGPDYDKYLPFIQKDIWQAIHRWCKALLLYKMEFDVAKGKGQSKVKGVAGSERRLIHTTPSVFWEAKNQYGLPDFIEAGDSPKEAGDALYQALVKAAAS